MGTGVSWTTLSCPEMRDWYGDGDRPAPPPRPLADAEMTRTKRRLTKEEGHRSMMQPKSYCEKRVTGFFLTNLPKFVPFQPPENGIAMLSRWHLRLLSCFGTLVHIQRHLVDPIRIVLGSLGNPGVQS